MSKRRRKTRHGDAAQRVGQENRQAADDPPAQLGEKSRRSYLPTATCLLLVLAIAAVFGQTFQHGFVNYDDNEYVYANPHITRDPPTQGIAWALASTELANWHPLTWLSHILDFQLYGLHAGGHHLSSVLFHALNAILLFLVLRRMTGDLWPSAFVAAVFGVHPLHVESVAWVAERKDVLSGLCFVLILWAYARYVERPASWGRYAAVVALVALGLMAKPMLVTVPFVLLLLDYWPLGRILKRGGADILVASVHGPGNQGDGGGFRTNGLGHSKSLPAKTTSVPFPQCLPHRLIIEKIPLLLLAGISCVVTPIAQQGAIQALDVVPLPWRIANALVSYVVYLRQTVWPTGLAVLYPHPHDDWSLWQAAVAAAALAGITAGALVCRRKCPAILVGWLWYLGMLVPVIGLVQVGEQAMADRYTYLPQIGLCIAAAWGVASAARSWAAPRWPLPAASLLVVAALLVCAWRQTGYWRDSKTLWRRALSCTTGNAVAEHNLGQSLADDGEYDQASKHYCAALRITSDYADAHFGLGVALEKEGRIDEAIAHYRRAVQSRPNLAEAQNNLAVALTKRGEFEEAIAHFRKALESQKDYAEAHSNLAAALAKSGQIDAAMGHFREAVRLKPEQARFHYNLGIALARQEMNDEAINQFQEALRINPNYAGARQMLDATRSQRENRLKQQQ